MTSWKSVGGFLGKTYDYLTPGKGSNRLTDWSGWGDSPSYSSGNGGGGGGGGGWGDPNPKPRPSSISADSAKLIADNNALIAQLRAQQEATPKLARFDVMNNWTQAKSAAERAWNPVYEKKLNDYLANNLAKKTAKERDFNLNIENITNEKTNTLAENAVNRTRTAEDTALAVGQINTKEGQFQTDEGQSFDQNYRQVAEQLGASGAATTGLGKQQTSDMVRLRNVTSQRQLDEFQGQRQAKELFKTRTFEDLARGDATAAQLAESKKKAAQFDLDSYLEDLAYDEKVTRFDTELERQTKVLQETQTQADSGVESFLAGLAGQGYDAKDIAYNRSVYA